MENKDKFKPPQKQSVKELIFVDVSPVIKIEKVEVLNINVNTVVIKQEEVTDDEYEFDFKIKDEDYFKIVKDLKDKDDDLEELEEIHHKCSREKCGKIFKNEKNLMLHMKQHEISNFCHLCGFLVEGDLNYHLKNHDKKPKPKPKCDLCGKEFLKTTHLRTHLKNHQESFDFECNWCSKKLKSYQSLQTHIRRHTDVKEFICDLCGKEMGNEEMYNKHMKKHGTNHKFSCNICFTSFSHFSTLSRHKKIHAQTFSCVVPRCNEKFSFDSHLRRHLLQAHKDLDAISIPRQIPKHVNYRDRRKFIKDEVEYLSSESASELH